MALKRSISISSRPGRRPVAASKAVTKPRHDIIAIDHVLHVGDQVAVVIADTYAHARDAAEAIDVDYDVLKPVVDVVTAFKPGAPQVSGDGTGKQFGRGSSRERVCQYV